MTDSVYRTYCRTHLAGELRAEHADQEVRLAGWVHRRRDLGGLYFIDLRDHGGIVQVSCGPDWTPDDVLARVTGLGPESVVGVVGRVVPRPAEAVNAEMATGEIEVRAERVELLARAETPPILVAYGPEEELAAEELRLRYRFLDLRRADLQRNFRVRHRMLHVARTTLDELGFVEVETPILTRPTPEGARDYLAPSRRHHGEFYALPQSPQLYKQILMVAGFDRYFQIARCLRDEDLRADRQPEFSQIDVEMSFADEDDIFAVGERVVHAIWKECAECDLEHPFRRITYREALEKYGTDRPDLRIDWQLTDLSDVLGHSDFRIFQQAVDQGGRVRGFRVPGGAELSRKQLDELDGVAQGAGAPGALWTRIDESGASGGFGKQLSDGTVEVLRSRCALEDGDLLIVVAGPERLSGTALDALRRHLGGVMDAVADGYRWAWITDFPLLEEDLETGAMVPTRHPFTMPRQEDVERLEDDPSSVRLRAYDLVCNGFEFASGSIRVHKPELQRRVFRALGIGDEEAEDRFGFLLEAFTFGAPPHGGFAMGVDRMTMVLTGSRSLRDVIAFPKTTAARALMERAPSPVAQEELDELGIKVVKRADA